MAETYVRKIAFKILWHLSWRLGYVLQDRKMTPLKVYGNDPRELSYLINLPFTQLNLPAASGVGLRFYPLTGKTYHPFVLALREAMQSQHQEDAAYEVLKKYSELVSLNSANDFLGLEKNVEVFSSDNHPYEYTYPWSPLRPDEVKEAILLDIREENMRYGLASDESLGLKRVSEEKIKIETSRLVSLMLSIKEQGFKQQKEEDPIGGLVLIDGEDWRWIVQGGQHRASVMAALGYERIPVYIKQVVRRGEVCFWPGVQSSIYQKEEALMVFDRLFTANPPPVAKGWVEYVNKAYNHSISIH